MRYFIIGFKSSGKTTLGKKIAEKLEMTFLDLDEEIEKMTGRAVTNIFSQDGEEEFRIIEWNALKEVVKQDHIVVATGGGVPCHCENMSLMEKHGEVIYLKVNNQILVSRLEKMVTHRPIVKNKTREELYHYVEDLKNRCEHNYLRAKYILEIESENFDLNTFIKQLKKQAS